VRESRISTVQEADGPLEIVWSSLEKRRISKL